MAENGKDSDKHLTPGPGSLSRETVEQAAYEDEKLVDVHEQVGREKEEPTEGFSPVPIFLLFIFSALIFFCGVYVTKYSGGYRPDVFDPDAAYGDDKPPPIPLTPEELVAKKGPRLYSQCAACHQSDGSGLPGAFPPLAESEWVNGDERRIVKLLLWGLNGEIQVKGNTYNGNMPSYNSMKDEEIRIIASYVRTHFGNESGIVSEGVVEAMRAETSGRTGPWTGPELLAEHPLEE